MHYSSEILDLYPMKCGFIIMRFTLVLNIQLVFLSSNNLLLVMLDVYIGFIILILHSFSNFDYRFERRISQKPN